MDLLIITEDEAQQAFAWGANCGPFALAAVSGLGLEAVRPALAAVKFEKRRYTSPAMMYGALNHLGIRWRKNGIEIPTWGLARVQWEGPWTEAGRPMRERYRHTHWIGLGKRGNEVGVFDVNALDNGSGWISWHDWTMTLVPLIVEHLVPGGSGAWHFTRTIEVMR